MDNVVFYWSVFGALVGSILTTIVQAIIQAVSAKQAWKREITKPIILRKLDVSEKALVEINETLDIMKNIKILCDMNQDSINLASVSLLDVIQKQVDRLSSTREHPNISALEVYYDFSNLNKIFDEEKLVVQIAELTQWLNSSVQAETDEAYVLNKLHEIHDLILKLSDYYTAIKEKVRLALCKNIQE